MGFGLLLLIEGVLLFAAGVTFVGGIKGIISSVVVLSGIAWLTHPQDFWNWEIILFIVAALAVGILLYFAHKAKGSGIVMGLAGGLGTFVVFGAFLTSLLSLVATLLTIGTGLIPHLKRNQVLWGVSPSLWRLLIGVCWIVMGNIMI